MTFKDSKSKIKWHHKKPILSLREKETKLL